MVDLGAIFPQNTCLVPLVLFDSEHKHFAPDICTLVILPILGLAFWFRQMFLGQAQERRTVLVTEDCIVADVMNKGSICTADAIETYELFVQT